MNEGAKKKSVREEANSVWENRGRLCEWIWRLNSHIETRHKKNLCEVSELCHRMRERQCFTCICFSMQPLYLFTTSLLITSQQLFCLIAKGLLSLAVFFLPLPASDLTPVSSLFPYFSLAESQKAETSCQRGTSDSIISLPLPVFLPPFLFFEADSVVTWCMFLTEINGVTRQNIHTTVQDSQLLSSKTTFISTRVWIECYDINTAKYNGETKCHSV